MGDGISGPIRVEYVDPPQLLRQLDGSFRSPTDPPLKRSYGRVTFDVARVSFGPYEIRAIVIEGGVWFVEQDVIISLPGVRGNIRNVPNHDRLIINRSQLSRGRGALQASGGAEELTLISEPGVIRLCMWSPSGPSAMSFTDWVIREASPSLRAAGLAGATFDTLPIKRTRAELAKHKAREAPHTLYRMFNEKEELLYVGISMSGLQRMMSHRATKKWYREIERIDFQHYPCYETAREDERRAIATESPKYNIAS